MWDVTRQVTGVRVSPGINMEVWERKTFQRTIGLLCSRHPMVGRGMLLKASGKRKKVSHRGTHMGPSQVLWVLKLKQLGRRGRGPGI